MRGNGGSRAGACLKAVLMAVGGCGITLLLLVGCLYAALMAVLAPCGPSSTWQCRVRAVVGDGRIVSFGYDHERHGCGERWYAALLVEGPGARTEVFPVSEGPYPFTLPNVSDELRGLAGPSGQTERILYVIADRTRQVRAALDLRTGWFASTGYGHVKPYRSLQRWRSRRDREEVDIWQISRRHEDALPAWAGHDAGKLLAVTTGLDTMKP